MIDERDLLKRIVSSAEVEHGNAAGPGLFDTQRTCRLIINIIERALAGHPPPDAVPELPEWVEHNDISMSWHVALPSGLQIWLTDRFDPADLDHIAVACRILAARRRASVNTVV